MLKIKVKVGNVTNLSDARYCAGMGVTFLGFPVGPHHGIDPKRYKEITDWVSGPQFVIEWPGETMPENFEELILPYNADFVQCDAKLIGNIPSLPVPLIISLAVADWRILSQELINNKGRVAYLLLLNPSNAPVDSNLIQELAMNFQVLLGFGILEKKQEELVSMPIAGIALEGTDESSPGMQDYSHLSQVFELLEVDD